MPEEVIATDRLLVYDMPVELIKQYISISKLFFNNRMCKAMEEGMGLLLAKYSSKFTDAEEKLMLEIIELSRRITQLELALKERDEPKEAKTFGGGN